MKFYVILGGLIALGIVFSVFSYRLGLGHGEKLGRERVLAGSPFQAVPSVLGGATTSSQKSGDAQAASKAQTGQSTRALISEAMSLLQGGFMNQNDMVKALSLMQKLEQADIPEALAFLQEKATNQQQMMLLGAVLSRWAEFDAPKALEYALENTKPQQRMMTLPGIMAAWASKDAGAALRWYEENRDSELMGTGMLQGRVVLASVFGALAAEDMDDAMAQMADLQDPQELQMALSGIVSRVFDVDQRLRLLKSLDTLEDDQLRLQAHQQLITHWAMFDSGAAVAWLDEQGSLRESDRKVLEQSVASMWMQNEPEKAAEWLMSKATDEDRAERIQQVVGSWVYQDPNGAAEWMAQFAPGEEVDGALQTLAFGVQQRDEESALAWAEIITDEDKRHATVEQVIRQWYRRDASAAEAALGEADLPEERRQRLREENGPQPKEVPDR